MKIQLNQYSTYKKKGWGFWLKTWVLPHRGKQDSNPRTRNPNNLPWIKLKSSLKSSKFLPFFNPLCQTEVQRGLNRGEGTELGDQKEWVKGRQRGQQATLCLAIMMETRWSYLQSLQARWRPSALIAILPLKKREKGRGEWDQERDTRLSSQGSVLSG